MDVSVAEALYELVKKGLDDGTMNHVVARNKLAEIFNSCPGTQIAKLAKQLREEIDKKPV